MLRFRGMFTSGMFGWRKAHTSGEGVDRILQAHTEAMDCRDCEDYLRLGLQAFNWLRTACKHIAEDIHSGQGVFNEELEQSITELYANWLEPCAEAEEWAAQQEHRGYTVDTATEFRGCCQEARDILEQRSLVHAARRARLHATDECVESESW